MGSEFDLDGKGLFNALDRDYLIETVSRTAKGDANLDGVVGFDDFLLLSANFRSRGTWQQGDFDGNGTVGFDDFLLLIANGTVATVNAWRKLALRLSS